MFPHTVHNPLFIEIVGHDPNARILFRQNASWQGSVVWVEGRQEERFRSALELVLLMDSALTAQK